MSVHGYITVVGWEKFQHYKDRNPAWIKMHLDLMGNDEWLALPPADRVLLLTIWMLTARYGQGRVMADLSWLQAHANLPRSNRYQGLDRLVQAGFIRVRASKALAKRLQAASTERETEKETEKEPPHSPPQGGEDWQGIWQAYQEHHPRATLTPARKQLIQRRLRDHPAETLVAAINGNHSDPWCNGENPGRREYHGLDLILRSADTIERYSNVQANGKPRKRSMEEWEAIIAEYEGKGHQ